MNLITLPIFIPLLSGAIILLLPQRRLRNFVAGLAGVATLAISLTIFRQALTGDVLVVQMANWAAPWGISLVADMLSSTMLLLSSFIGLLTILFASSSLQHEARRGQGERLNALRERFGFQALLQFLIMGVNMSFLTGDLFNLFVAFEVMLIASYGLLLLGNELPQLREGFKYVIMNLVASAIFVAAAGFAYGLFGTLNMADIAQKVAEHGSDQRITLVAMMLALVFATKSAVFPLGFWLPNSYPVPAAAASAFFAALLTKVGAYTLIRTFTLMFPEEALIKTIIFVMAGLTMLVGALGMIAQQRWRHALAFANVASIGYIIMGVFSSTQGSLSAALYYLMHSVMVVFTLFLIAALAEKIAGLRFNAEGHLNIYPWLGVAYFISALALAGIPPTSGFIAKYSLISELLKVGSGLHNWIAAAAVIAGFLLLYGAVEIWREFFWGESDAVHSVSLPTGMKVITVSAVTALVLLAIAGGPAYQVADLAAEQLTTNKSYIDSVLVEAELPTHEGADEISEDTHSSDTESESDLNEEEPTQNEEGGN